MRLLLLILCACIIPACLGIDVNVTSGLSDAIAIAVDGDTIVIPSGTYTGANNTNLYLYGRTLTFQSESGDFNDVVIDCENSNASVIIVQYNYSDPHPIPNFGSGVNTSLSFSGISFVNCASAMFINSTNTTGNCSLSVSRCQFSLNRADLGGAIYAEGAHANATIADSVFSENDAIFGGAMYGKNGVYFNITNSSYYSNYADSGGGAILLYNFATMDVSNCVFYLNHAKDEGGAIDMYYNCFANVTDANFTNNIAGNFGGGLTTDTSLVYIYNSLFDGNGAQIGGGLYVKSLNSIGILFSTSFVNNYAFTYGGAMSVIDDSAILATDCNVTSNYAYIGGGIAAITIAIVEFTDMMVANNTAYMGGAIYVEDGVKLTVQSSAIFDNFAEIDGDTIYCLNSNINVNETEVLVYSNKTEQNGVFCDAIPNYTWCTIRATHSGNWSEVCLEPTPQKIVVPTSSTPKWVIPVIIVGCVVGALLLGFMVAYVIAKKFHSPIFNNLDKKSVSV